MVEKSWRNHEKTLIYKRFQAIIYIVQERNGKEIFMNKLVKILAASALVATVLVGCGKKGETATGGSDGAAYAKAGLGIVSSVSDGQVNTTFAGIGLDKDGKIAWIDVDVAQGTPDGGDAQYTQTKKQRKDDYGMKSTSAQIGKIEGGAEWYEQIAKFEEYCKGKTPDEVAKIETEKNGEGNDVPKSGSDLAAGCTMAIGDFQAAVKKAADNAQEVSTDKLSLGRAMSYESDNYQEPWTYMTADVALVATDGDGKVQWIDIDTAKIDKEGKTTQTKTEQKEKYNMKANSGIGKEWYEQTAAFEEYCKGKTADEIANIAKGDDGKTTDTDLSAGCTIVITQFQAAIADALK